VEVPVLLVQAQMEIMEVQTRAVVVAVPELQTAAQAAPVS
jgi:hypothetical protein